MQLHLKLLSRQFLDMNIISVKQCSFVATKKVYWKLVVKNAEEEICFRKYKKEIFTSFFFS